MLIIVKQTLKTTAKVYYLSRLKKKLFPTLILLTANYSSHENL